MDSLPSGSRSKLSAQLSEIDSEVDTIDEEIRKLKRRRQELLEKKSQLNRRLDSSAASNLDSEDRWENGQFAWSEDANKILKDVFKLPSFRPLQKATINSVISGEDTIVIMSTGGGKSLCYQLPAILSKGLTLVVSPLISLVEDQLGQLRKLGIEAATLNSGTSKEEAKRIETAITNKESDFRLLYVTPEKLAKSKRIMNKLEKSVSVGFLKLIAIDEVHCCSQWGHDFRTDYKFLNVLKRQFKRYVPLLGLTATATASVIDDVKEMLGIPAAIVFRAGFNRPNLKYEVVQKKAPDATAEIADVIKSRFLGQSGIVYCFSRKDCEETAKKLRSLGISAAFYHAYLEAAQRTSVHERWLSGKYQVIVATVAFGMGIDKPDVRFVIHHAIPKSIENYYQESGRAGRDGNPSVCLLFFRLADVFRLSTMVCTEKTGLQNLYSMVRFATTSSTCRRSLLADHFEETWEAGWCQMGCDVCGSGTVGEGKSEAVDVSQHMRTAAAVIKEHLDAASDKDASGRITGSKLIEKMSSKSKISKDTLESVICHLLLEGYLQEDFHFTPYSIISYIQPSAKWNRDTSISIQMRLSSGLTASGKKSPSSSTSTSTTATPKPVHTSSSSSSKKRKIIESDDSDDDVIVIK